MKKILLFLLASVILSSVNAQLTPVSWKFSSKRISDKVFEIHLTATIKSGWHLYSQTQPADAIALPTKVLFTKNPLVVIDGKVAEKGKMTKVHDAALSATMNEYSGSVDFVQKVTLKAPVKTSVAGVVEYQTCDDKKCLPPKKVSFSVSL
jgi:hypothetical protein